MPEEINVALSNKAKAIAVVRKIRAGVSVAQYEKAFKEDSEAETSANSSHQTPATSPKKRVQFMIGDEVIRIGRGGEHPYARKPNKKPIAKQQKKDAVDGLQEQVQSMQLDEKVAKTYVSCDPTSQDQQPKSSTDVVMNDGN